MPLPKNLPENLPPAVTQALDAAKTALGPIARAMGQGLQRLMQASATSSLGGTFRHLCVVGLNRAELLYYGEEQSIFGENWQDLTDESMRRGMALIFFAPRGYDGQPVNPYLFLAGEQLGANNTDDLGADSNTLALAQQLIGNLPLLDFCRMSPAQPNTVNIVIAADTLFHWDVKDSYVFPTTPTSWPRDVEQVLKGYPRTTRAHIYTQWDTTLLAPSDRITMQSLRSLPLDPQTWINRPTVQEAYGNHILAAGILAAMLTTGGLYLKQRGLDDLNEELRVIEQQIPREGRSGDLDRAVREQEQMMQVREIFYLTTKDAARAIQGSGFQAANFEVRAPDVQAVPKQYLVTVEAERDAYKGWLQEEPIAKSMLVHSALMQGVRKQPATTFKVEGLVDIPATLKSYRQLVNTRAKPGAAGKAAAVSTTEAE